MVTKAKSIWPPKKEHRDKGTFTYDTAKFKVVTLEDAKSRLLLALQEQGKLKED